jgi:ligand-binding sensor domain-containing protein
MAVMPAALNAEKLPIRAYTTADGLPHNTVFDGYTLQRYGAEQGLRGSVTDLLETRMGEYWVATLDGLYRFHPVPPRPGQTSPNAVSGRLAAQPMFELFPLSEDGSPQGINTLHEDRRGTIWAATNEGLYRLMRDDSRWTAHLVDLEVPGKAANTVRVLELMEDHDGALWISLPQAGLRQLLPNGRTNRYTTLGMPVGPATSGPFEGIVNTMLEDHDRRVWLGTDRGLSLLVRRSGGAQLERVRTFTSKDGLRDDDVSALMESAGDLWAGTSRGLSRLCLGSACGGKSFRSYDAPALRRFGAWTLVNDRDGNLWMGNETGALRLARDGFTTYDEADGLGSSRVYTIAENSAGTLYVVTPGPHGGDVNEYDGKRFRRISPTLQRSAVDPVAPLRSSVVQDHAGDWWVTTEQGLYQYSGVTRVEALARMRPTAVYTSRSGLPPAAIISLYGDSRGDLWVGSNLSSAAAGALSRWQRSTRTFHVYGAAEGRSTSAAALAFCEDRSGNLWVGFPGDSVGRLARYHEGRFRVFTSRDGLAAGSVWSLYLDHAGRLWVATTEGGVARVDHPEAEPPHFATYTTVEGLASNQVQAITEDQ